MQRGCDTVATPGAFPYPHPMPPSALVRLALPFTIALALAACTRGRDTGSGVCAPGLCDPDLGGRDLGSVDAGPPGLDGGPILAPDLGPPDLGRDYRDAAPVVPCTVACGDTELCGDTGDGNGFDDDCDGAVDEDCTCTIGTTRACFLGPPDRRGIGVCADGLMACTEFLQWGPCSGGQFPGDELCDGADNDCNGLADDGIAGCATALFCPGSEAAIPLSTHALRGSRIYTGSATSWQWTISCPSTVATCPLPMAPTSADTDIYFAQSGSYRARLEVTTESGETLSCEWVIFVQGAGLRVELAWDTQGPYDTGTDVDLHLHRRTVPDGALVADTDFFTDDDCYYANCKASTYGGIWGGGGVRDIWGLPDTPDVTACSGAPNGEGAAWAALGACYNPRLDVDIISCDPAITDPMDPGGNFCAPENINVDNPPNGSTYRIMVDYFSSRGLPGATHPTVNVYCGGDLRGSFGSDPFVELTDDSQRWLVADVKFFTDACGAVTCSIEPLGSLIRTDQAFGPPWSF